MTLLLIGSAPKARQATAKELLTDLRRVQNTQPESKAKRIEMLRLVEEIAKVEGLSEMPEWKNPS